MGEQNSQSPPEIFGKIVVYSIIVISSLYFGLTIFVHFSLDRPQFSPASACINNLRQIDAAANEFALEHHLTNGDHINFPNDLTPYIKLNKDGKIPSCPSGGIYQSSIVGVAPTCSLGTTVTPAHVLP
jgi:hypothetical protein